MVQALEAYGEISMKCNKKVVALNLLASMLISNSAFAKIEGVRGERASGSGAGRGSNGKTETKVSVATPQEGTVVKPAIVASCNSDMDTAKYFPQELFRNITRDGENITIEKRENNKIFVKIPPVINVCGSFVPELRQNKDSKDITVLMKLVGKKDGIDTDLTYKEFENCLENAKVKTKVGENEEEKPIVVNGKLNHDIVPGKMYSETIYSMDYDFDPKVDYAKSVKLSFGYPSEYDNKNGYDPLYGFDKKATVAGDACMRAETIGSKDPFYINEGKDVWLSKINQACGNGAQAISEARASLGNADALKDIADKLKAELDAAYLVAVKADVKDIFKKMSVIEDKLVKGRADIKEKEAKKLVEQYAEEAKKLDSIFLGKAIERVDLLMQKREKMEEGSEAMVALDKEIKQLNADISEFSKRSASSLDSLYSVMEKYAITDHAETIESILVKSGTYGKVYGEDEDSTRGKPLTIEAAQEEHKNKMIKFTRTMVDWRDVYAVGKGNTAIMERTMKEYDNWTNRMSSKWVAFNKKEQEDETKFCSIGWTGAIANPVKCSQHRSGAAKRQARIVKQLEKDDKVRGRLKTKFGKMDKSLTEYERKMAENNKDSDGSEFTGSSYSGYEESFEDRFPGYYGGRVSTAGPMYDPNMYNLGNPNMPQPQLGGMQRYPAQVGGAGWPSIP